jgi:iron complex outermembrane receptor protein
MVRLAQVLTHALFMIFLFHATAWADEFDREINFDVAAQSLAAAILDFAEQSKIQVVTSGAALDRYQTKGLKGRFTARAALKSLLEGTGLEFRKVGDGTVSIETAVPTSSNSGLGAGQAAVVLDSVIVTAQKRPEPDQAVPISITALSSRALDIYRVENLGDLSRLVPGLLISTFSENSPAIAIRGANNTFEQIGVSKPVAVVIDDVFVSRTSGSVFDLFDLESVNVLEGPQGTLFGRNVTGGTVVIETSKPTFDHWGAAVEGSAGNWGDVQYKALANLPFNDVVAMNVSASMQRRDGYGEDRLTGGKEDDINSQNVRAKVLLTPLDSVSVLFSADHGYDYNGDRTLSSTSLGDDGDRRTSELGVAQHFSRVLGGGSMQATSHGTAGELTSISAYRSTRSNELYSGVGASYTFLSTGSQTVNLDDDQVRTFTQELRYASPKWQWADFVTGFYYLNESGHRRLGVTSLAARTGARAGSTLADEFVHTDSYAGFADGTVHLLSTLDLSAGVRYTVDRKTASLEYNDFIHTLNTFDAQEPSASWSQSTPRGVLSWHPTGNTLLYGSVTKGFTAGGFNADAFSPKAFAQTFAPETVTSYEVGAKTQWLADTLRLNAAAFDMKYHNKQELVFNSTNGILDIVNAAEATSKGFELTAAYKPVRTLHDHAFGS